jgi:ABC-type polysaccharide transport system permease subunit
LLLVLAAFIGSSWVGFKLFFIERPDDDFFRVAIFVLLYGLLGLVVFIFPIYVGSRCVFNKIKSD